MDSACWKLQLLCESLSHKLCFSIEIPPNHYILLNSFEDYSPNQALFFKVEEKLSFWTKLLCQLPLKQNSQMALMMNFSGFDSIEKKKKYGATTTVIESYVKVKT